jgi:asparagine synthase (glutamine-hydrolysing)
MCGICGQLNFDPDQPIAEDLIRQMCDVIVHRGPDDEGIWIDGPVGLGQRRLAIIDLSPTGHQPMSNEDGTIWITYNGEIYNHLDLRADLERRGHCYRGTSDTETILHLYEEYGPNCVKYLRGMFAFALWDAHRRRLLLARDRFGQKPLLYAETPDGLTFASEIKAILQDPAISRDVDEVALHHYLTYGYIPTPKTAFHKIRKLPPASILLWESGRISIERYWTLRYTPKLKLRETEAVEQLLAVLREATGIRLMSEVPLGAFLSGGIDSSAIVALMAETMSEPVKTFSIGFDDQSFNELHYARQVAERYATDHHEFIVTPDALAMLPELVWAYGEPYADSSALPTYYVAKMTRQYVTVALNGDGGDEAFAGYDRYLANRLALGYERLPTWLREGLIAPVVHRLPESTRRKDPLSRLRRFVLAMDATPERRYAHWMALFDNKAKNDLYTSDFRARMRAIDSLTLLEQAFAVADGSDFLDRTQYADVTTYLLDDLLVKVDIATMVHSLEGRSPFLDHRLAEFAARLPSNYKLRGYKSKYILKQALRDHLPKNILQRDKQGFGLPIGRWFRHDLRHVIYEVLLDQRTLGRGILDGWAVRTMLDEHVSGRINHQHRIWGLLVLELWFRTYVDRPLTMLTMPATGIL